MKALPTVTRSSSDKLQREIVETPFTHGTIPVLAATSMLATCTVHEGSKVSIMTGVSDIMTRCEHEGGSQHRDDPKHEGSLHNPALLSGQICSSHRGQLLHSQSCTFTLDLGVEVAASTEMVPCVKALSTISRCSLDISAHHTCQAHL